MYLECTPDVFHLDFVQHPHRDLALGMHSVHPDQEFVDRKWIVHDSVELFLDALIWVRPVQALQARG